MESPLPVSLIGAGVGVEVAVGLGALVGFGVFVGFGVLVGAGVLVGVVVGSAAVGGSVVGIGVDAAPQADKITNVNSKTTPNRNERRMFLSP